MSTPPTNAVRSLGRAVFALAREPAPQPRRLFADGVPIHYTEVGDREAEPVLLLHGFAVNERLNWPFPGVTRALAKSHRVISVDIRGHGRSGKPHDPRQYGANLVADVTRVLARLGINQAHLVDSRRGSPQRADAPRVTYVAA